MKEDMTKNVRSAPHKQARKPELRVEKPVAEDLLVGRNAVSEALKGQRPLNPEGKNK